MPIPQSTTPHYRNGGICIALRIIWHRLLGAKKCQIKWIADYRDDWSTRDFYKDSFSKKIINIFNRYYEKMGRKQPGHYFCFCLPRSTHCKPDGQKGYLMHNGYMPENYTQHYQPFDDFTISYTGSVYASQPIELFLDGVKSL